MKTLTSLNHIKLILRHKYVESFMYIGHTGYVTSLCVASKGSGHPEGLVITGSRDTSILVYPRSSGEPIHTLTGHTDSGNNIMY